MKYMILCIAGLAFAAPALACDKEKPPLAQVAHGGSGAKPFEMKSVENDQRAADEAFGNFSPICVDQGFGSGCEEKTKPTCESLTPEQLQHATYYENHRRYRVDASQRGIWKKAYERLYKKWEYR